MNCLTTETGGASIHQPKVDSKLWGEENWRRPKQPHPGTRVSGYRCSLPGLAGFTAYRCEGTAWATTDSASDSNQSQQRARILAESGQSCKSNWEIALDRHVNQCNIDVNDYYIEYSR